MSVRARRVARVLAAAARIADAADPLGVEARARLRSTSGLSRQGVELALSGHLERGATEGELAAFAASAASAPRCHVVLAANVCTAGVRAIAWAAATSPEVLVRPSRRDPVVAELLCRALSTDDAFEGRVDLVAEVAPRDRDELHVYGGEDAIAAYGAWAAAGVVVRAHGPGFGVAYVGPRGDVRAAAEELARDVVPFDQRGCLSPRVAFVDGDAARVEAFARALAGALEAWQERVPRGPIDADVASALATYRATFDAVGLALAGDAHVVGVDPAPRALTLAPPARAVHVVAASAEAAAALLGPIAASITILGVWPDDHDAAALARGFRCRVAALGTMQRPPLDGPVDLRALPKGPASPR